MAALQSSSSQLALHLADRALTPILSSSRAPSSNYDPQSQGQAQALSSLTTAAITAYDTAARLGLGLPQRIMIETQSLGPIILHSYLIPPSTQRTPTLQDHEDVRGIVEQTREDLRPLSGTTNTESTDERAESNEALVNGIPEVGGAENAEAGESTVQPPPLLIASVVAPTSADRAMPEERLRD